MSCVMKGVLSYSSGLRSMRYKLPSASCSSSAQGRLLLSACLLLGLPRPVCTRNTHYQAPPGTARGFQHCQRAACNQVAQQNRTSLAHFMYRRTF